MLLIPSQHNRAIQPGRSATDRAGADSDGLCLHRAGDGSGAALSQEQTHCLLFARWASRCRRSLWGSMVVRGDLLPLDGFYGMVRIDGFALLFKVIFLIGAALAIAISTRYLDIEGEQHGEYYALVLFATVGMMFLAAATI